MTTALACPRCSNELPADAFYGPCVACRTELNAATDAKHAAKLERVADALAAGWTSDPARRCWVRTEDCGECDGRGRTASRTCNTCNGAGETETLIEWEGGR